MMLQQILMQRQEQRVSVIWVKDEKNLEWCFRLKPGKKTEARRRGYEVGICSDQSKLDESWTVLSLWGVTGFADLILSP